MRAARSQDSPRAHESFRPSESESLTGSGNSRSLVQYCSEIQINLILKMKRFIEK